MTAAPTSRAYLAWMAVCLIWGTTYLAIRISLETLPPLLMAAVRWIVAGSLLVAILKVRGERMRLLLAESIVGMHGAGHPAPRILEAAGHPPGIEPHPRGA